MGSMRVSHCNDAAIIEAALKDVDTFDLNAAIAALSAQPSPGGQGDAPSIDYEDLLDQAKDLIHCGCSVNGAFEWLLEQLTDGEALAARQPSKQPDSVALGEATEFCIEKGDHQPVGEPVVTYCGRRLTPEGTRECWGVLSAGVEDLPQGTKLYAAPAQAVDLGQQQDAARWRAIAPHLSVEWDEDEMLKRWTWIDFKGDALSVPTRTRESYASVDEAMDAVIGSQAVGK